ncbi:LPS biosynthesis protein [Cypionkella aquatica]|uniref:LPS biosynthesis protein n=1 Tax=Cypionkella aquatica TaxID=1756042 RepID=A0AA37TTW3_9RHOB|nr:rhamnan synthesis F family protein [Cypionkella aquatica]GLS85845.1 LPS biosynthesis protein [Cypionkella aquatica]
MPPLWIVKREVRRTLDQAKFPFLIASAPIFRKLHDRRKSRTSRLTMGSRTRGPNVALVLLYQPKGVLASTFETCRYLSAKGYSCLIVSNAVLSEGDRATLSPYCFEMLERPNFGYDFGGYRDGILHLLNSEVPMKGLLVLNDSIWFPTLSGEDFLDHVMAQKADIYGAVMARPKRRSAPNHLQSYAFAFGQSLVESPEFADYWRNLPVCNNRRWTIRQCECKMTEHFRQRGFSVGARWDFAEVVAAIGRLSDDDLVALLQWDARRRKNRALVVTPLLALRGQPEWRKQAEDYIHLPCAGKFILLLHPALLAEMGFPFLKKSFEANYTKFRPIYAQVLEGRCDPIVLAEVAQWDR